MTNKFLILLFLLIPLFILINQVVHLVTFQQYGDYGGLDVAIAHSRPFARWFLGSTLILDIYWKIWRQPFIYQIVQNLDFIPLLSTFVMSFSTILLLKKFGTKLWILFPILSPLWLMFSLGYDEYYPFIAPIFIFFLIWFFLSKTSNSVLSFVTGGTFASLLPLIYIGFTPISLISLISLTIQNYKKSLLSWAIFVSLTILLIGRFWPWGFEDFLVSAVNSLNLGEINTTFPRYQGQSAGIYSTNFSFSYAFSIEHLRDLVFMSFYSGGLGSLLLLIYGIFLYIRKIRPKLNPNLKNIPIATFTIAAVIVYQLYYLLFMIPKMGPERDIDLFFSVYLTSAFFAGIIWEKLISAGCFKNKTALILGYLGYSLLILYLLLIKGLPAI